MLMQTLTLSIDKDLFFRLVTYETQTALCFKDTLYGQNENFYL